MNLDYYGRMMGDPDGAPGPVGSTLRLEPPSADAFVAAGTLTVIAGPSTGACARLEGRRVLVGRAAGCDLKLDDARVSAVHLELVPTERGVSLRDLGSTNGTLIGSLRVHEVTLADGVEITVGTSTLLFRADAERSRLARPRRDGFHGLVGGSLAMRALYAELERLAPTQLNVLIEGETGTGKEEVARAIHQASPRSSAPFVTVDCGALTPTLLESTLFGHEKGAFSGALSRQEGLVEAADGGTLLLDEIGELPLEAQTRLLRLLEARTIRRVGGTREIRVDIRVLSATHRNLPAMVAGGTFRADLFFRLATARVHVPPLRERLDDLTALSTHLLERIAGPKAPVLSRDAISTLERRTFPGNVRELRNVLEVAAAFASAGRIEPSDLQRRAHEAPHAVEPTRALVTEALGTSGVTPARGGPRPLYREAKESALEAFERDYFAGLMADNDGNITRAAAQAGLERHHLRAMLKRRGLWKGRS
ncbi:MAG: sigma 54-dependent Fis family transcriptional regulator [Deltaproteobacteria bacterium]|nr:sigma 54-dependent Fis family transcriptional regulator [Deltaproteobacteria bacterium]